MFSHTLAVQGPNSQSAVLREIGGAAAAGRYDRITGAFAFATKKGARLLVDALSSAMPNWNRVEKEWVVSIDYGLTEPDALRFLRSIGRSNVRVANAREVLQRRFLRPKTCFHPKTLIMRSGTAPSVGSLALMVGSANLTVSGLCTNHEHLASAVWTHLQSSGQESVPAGILQQVHRVDALFAQASIASEALVREYTRVRPRHVTTADDNNPLASQLADRPVVSITRAAIMASSAKMWVEIRYVVRNRGRQREGNQIDLQRGCRAFFGLSTADVPKNSPLGQVTIRYGAIATPRNMRFGDNGMDKLDLPIPGLEGPPSYRNTTLLFERSLDGSFKMTVGTAHEAQVWKSTSREQGTLYRMQGGREYGVMR